MKIGDARTLSQDAQQEVADELDVTRQAVGKWWKLFKDGGWAAL